MRQLAAAQLLPNINLGTNYDLHRGAIQQSSGNILTVNRDAMYVGFGANAVGAGTVNVPGLNYNLNVGEGWFAYLATRQRVAAAGAVATAVRNDVLLRVCLAYLDLLRAEGRQAIARGSVRPPAGRRPRRPVIMLTAHGTTDTAMGAMTRGAFDYLTKLFDLDQVTQLLGPAFETARLMREPAALPDDPRGDRIIGRSAVVQEMGKQIGRVAPQDVTVLILGESGTGKELVARSIYQHLRRDGKPFLAINCAAIPEGLVESELFGHEPGAFTGAGRRRIGRFEQASGGTLFLDEIGDMPPAVQAKVLRLIQDQTFERVGGGKPISTRVRILAATNQDIERLIADGRFRGDLYYRLKGETVRVPPLRDRAADIPDLAHHFLARFTREAAPPAAQTPAQPVTVEVTSRGPAGASGGASSRAPSSRSSPPTCTPRRPGFSPN